MAEAASLQERIRPTASKRVLFLPHAVRQSSRPERMISTAEVREVLIRGVVVEEYPADPREPSALLLGHGQGGRAIHVVTAPKQKYAAVITAYVPDTALWNDEMKTRRQPQ
ncbi:MAG: DUF4258 domain-containing protein [Deltaproteobacteria bacterium]|nr:DUF4258 domain-containing protein [Deltaproteobacteria bacterium]